MAAIEPYELEIFRRYHLNPERISRYRMRLACEPPAPAKVLNGYKRKLASYSKKIGTVHKAFEERVVRIREDMGPLKNEMWKLHVTWDDPANVCLGGGQCSGMQPYPGDDETHPLSWDLNLNRWGLGRALENSDCWPAKPIYTERPEKEDALRAWNLFLIAFREAPARMVKRTWMKPACYYAEYRDINGEPVIFVESDIRLSRPAAKAQTA